ncbi:hypothetical protein SAMN05444920_113221 [Nonomuraea solani]|uniref:Uncharacterized protein n=2 Tax=Nonomuraea solani TaxID=1144553 RepID=A0A1H6ERP9_9ACTN|nr:hypothetical protein SAMN05444920_113221 [Nonomuraea solani]
MAWVAWAATLAAAFKLSARRDAGERGADDPVPAPVAELLRGMRAQDVFHSALFELAGRGWVTIEGDRLSLGEALEEPPRPYEKWVLERVRARLAGAPQAPEIALMPEGVDLDGGFVPLVRQCAIDLGLARRRWPSLAVPLLLAAALVVPWYTTVTVAGIGWAGGIATMVSFVAGISLLMGGRGFLLTPRGKEIAGTGPVNPRQEWIFTGSGWQTGEIEPASPRGPGRQEVTGHVVKRWVDAEPRHYYIALHDGSSRTATAFVVEQCLYQDVLPGDSVRLLVRPPDGTVVRMLAHDRHH